MCQLETEWRLSSGIKLGSSFCHPSVHSGRHGRAGEGLLGAQEPTGSRDSHRGLCGPVRRPAFHPRPECTPRGEKSFVPELKGLVTKACDILGLKNPCAVNPLSVTRERCDFTSERKLVSRMESQPHGHPGSRRMGGAAPAGFGGASPGSGLRSLLSKLATLGML